MSMCPSSLFHLWNGRVVVRGCSLDFMSFSVRVCMCHRLNLCSVDFMSVFHQLDWLEVS